MPLSPFLVTPENNLKVGKVSVSLLTVSFSTNKSLFLWLTASFFRWWPAADVEVAELLTSTLVIAVGVSCDLFPWVKALGVVDGAKAAGGLAVLFVCLFDSLWAPRAVKKSSVQKCTVTTGFVVICSCSYSHILCQPCGF